MAIIVLGTVRFAPENMEKIRPHLKALAEATNRDDGCVCYDVAEDLFDPGLVRFSEVWPTQESLQGHMKAPHIAPWREASQAVGIVERKFTVFDAENERPL